MDPDELVAVLDDPPPGLPPIRAVIPVHLYGQACDLKPMLDACARHGVAMIEDCSQAHGATLNGTKVGNLGAVACYSLYPTKNLGALGDGGVLTTDDAALADSIGAIRQYGWKERYISAGVGVNSRLDELQAAILRVKLTVLDANNARRQAIAAAYDAALAGGELAPPVRRAGAGHVFHQYVLRVPERASVMARLRAEGIATAIHYPQPVHLQPAYVGRTPMGPAGCAETARAAGEVMSLPMFPELTDAQVEQVCGALRRL
jgi:dTDP-4-amino-4,6-dideoxygalactose transaminase